METHEEVLRRDWDEEFIARMKRAILTSHYKYGWMSDTYPELAKAVDCIQERLDLYKKTHNADYLTDIANFAMIEKKCPSYSDAYFKPLGSSESPGLAGGISHKELMESAEVLD